MAAGKKTKTPKAREARPVVSPKKVKTKPAPSSAKKTAKTVPAASGRRASGPGSQAAIRKKEVRKGVVRPRIVMKKETGKDTKKQEPQRDRMTVLKSVLLKKREDIVAEAKGEIAKYVSGEARQLVDTAVDEGDWATVDISEDINLMRLGAHRRMLLNIDEALRKIREGTYGICEDCGEEISEKRLAVMPAATLCISCQENKERLESISKEDVE